ncbi:hypothetical protein FA13DRAFT_1809191 [Coprinellus micaceus]|uniref:Uncharacterized protein n=1 Tax=Coprinellus micaceus TaxID=71717 RepID=A0A4Y7TUD1_COPMI|nr:hypothetical protein FA13DRAFT_1809191 [Coprinellus micaceus]
MSTQVVASQDSSLLQNNHTLQAKNARLEGQIEDLIKERDQAKRWNERLRAKLDNARKGRRRIQLIIEGVRECKPRALWTDVLLPMLELELPGGVPGMMQVDIRNPSPPSSDTVVAEKRQYNTTTNKPFNESTKTVPKGTNTPVLKVSFFGRDGDSVEQEHVRVKREESPSKKRKL